MARAAANVLADRDGTRRPVAVVGRDPRASGEMLEAAVVAGLTSAGAEVLLAGVLPTPALAYLTARHGADLGIMISASHNPMPDNGIKLFAVAATSCPTPSRPRSSHGRQRPSRGTGPRAPRSAGSGPSRTQRRSTAGTSSPPSTGRWPG